MKDQGNISHNSQHSLDHAYENLKQKITSRGDLPYVTVSKQLEYLEEIHDMPLGKFLIERGGLNGYWTNYVVCEAQHVVTTSFVVDFLYKRAPITRAMRQRYELFQMFAQGCVKENATLASIPCGILGDLLTLDFSKVKNFKLVGIDYDVESLEGAETLTAEKGLTSHVELMQKDAWNLGIQNEFDLVTSSGLNIYEPNTQKVIDLYTQFFLSLKKGGKLVTGFLTPPPSTNHPGEWAMDKISHESALLQKILFEDILATKWQSFCTEQTMREIVQAAGFSNIEVHYDEAHIFPTVTAVKA